MVINKPTFNKPIVYADYNIWGSKLNTLLDLQDGYNGQLSTLMVELFASVTTLGNDKLNISEISTYVTPVMDNYLNQTIKPEINSYLNNTSYPSIDNYVGTKKTDLDDSITNANVINNTLITTIADATTSQQNLQDKINEVPSLIQNIVDEGATQQSILADGGYMEITDVNTDLPLQTGYYNIIDAQNNRYLVFVDDDLAIADGQVIRDASGFVRVQGVEMPCKIAIKTYPIVDNNTNGEVFLEVESDFENSGSSTAIKNLIK